MKPDHLFTYTAAALRAPLADLIARLDAAYAKIEPELAEARALKETNKGRTLSPPSNPELRAQNVLNAAQANRRDRQTAALWLAEVRRVWGWRKFHLTVGELAWLYQGTEATHARDRNAATPAP